MGTMVIRFLILVREKAHLITELLMNNEMLQREREYAERTREKFTGVSNTEGRAQTEASTKFVGFGSEDIAKYQSS
jgi:hypothetical protein